MTSRPPFPTESRSQRIGQNASVAFERLKPLSWRAKDLSGDDDVGIDYRVQVVENDQYRYAFHVQLKGTESPTVVENATKLAIELKTSTLNYYINLQEPVMLVVCDLSSSPDPREASAYFVWLNEQLSLKTESLAYISDGQKTHIVHIPLANTFDPDLDVSSYCRQQIRRKQASEGLLDAVATATSTDGRYDTTATVDSLTDRIRRGGRPFLDAVVTESSTPWIEAPEGTLPRKLSSAAESIRRCQHEQAREQLNSIRGELDGATAHECAEYAYLSAKAASLVGDSQTARALYRKARRTYPEEPKYLAACIEERLTLDIDHKRQATLKRLLRCLPASEQQEIVCLRSKLLAILREFHEAKSILNNLPRSRQHLPRALVAAIASDWETLLKNCDDGLSDHDSPG